MTDPYAAFSSPADQADPYASFSSPAAPAPAATPTPAPPTTLGGLVASGVDRVREGFGLPKPRSDDAIRATPQYQAQLAAEKQLQMHGGHAKPRNIVEAGLDAVTGYDPATNMSYTSVAPLPVLDEISGISAGILPALHGTMESVFDLFRKPGQQKGGAILGQARTQYLAAKDAQEEREQAYAGRHPIAAAALPMIVGAPERAAVAAAPAIASALSPAARLALVAKAGGKVAAVGGAYGAVSGVARGTGLADRIDKGVHDATIGAIAAPLVAGGTAGLAAADAVAGRLAGNVGRDLHRWGTSQPADPNAPAPITPEHTAAAESAVDAILRAGGLHTPADVDARFQTQFAKDPGATAAELAGRNGVGYVTALNRRPGASADLWENTLDARRASNPQHTYDVAEMHLGIDPKAAAGVTDRIVEKGREAAEPLYAQAHDAGPLDPHLQAREDVPTLEDLKRRPDVRAAIADAVRLARIAGDDPEGLGLVHMDRTVDDGLPGGPPGAPAAEVARPVGVFDKRTRASALGAIDGRRGAAGAELGPTEAELLRAIQNGESAKIRQGPSLLKYLADNGGLNDQGGELAGMDVGKWHQGKPFQRGVIQRDGLSIEDHAPLKAWEAGYFPELGETPPTREQFVEAVRKELAGAPRYADARYDPARQQRVQMLDDLEQQLHRQGIDPTKASPGEVGRAFSDVRSFDEQDMFHGGPGQERLYDEPAGERVQKLGDSPGPQVEPVPEVRLTSKTWDYVKRAMDDQLKGPSFTDPKTGELTAKGRASAQNIEHLLANIDAQNPIYAKARRTSQAYLGYREKFNDAGTWLGHTRDTHEFNTAWDQMRRSEQDGLRAGAVNWVHKLVENGHLKNGKFSTPGLREKFETMFGKPAARDFISAMEARSGLNRTGARMAPGLNSTTAEAEAFGKAQDGDAVRAFQPAMRQLLSGHPVGASMTALSQALLKALAYTKSTGLPVQVRDEAGRLLAMNARDLQAYMVRRAAATPTKRPPAGFPIGAVGQAGARGAVAVARTAP